MMTYTLSDLFKDDEQNICNEYMTVIDGKLTHIKIPEGVNYIKGYLFDEYVYLKSIELPCSIERIEEAAFRKAFNLNLINLPDTIEYIGDFAFYECRELIINRLPDNLKYIGKDAFAGCYKVYIDEIPQNVMYIHDYAFDKYSITKITFKGIPKYISHNAFNKCVNLKVINVPWCKGEVPNAPWGANGAKIKYASKFKRALNKFITKLQDADSFISISI